MYSATEEPFAYLVKVPYLSAVHFLLNRTL